jgi:hypothetical protein
MDVHIRESGNQVSSIPWYSQGGCRYLGFVSRTDVSDPILPDNHRLADQQPILVHRDDVHINKSDDAVIAR